MIFRLGLDYLTVQKAIDLSQTILRPVIESTTQNKIETCHKAVLNMSTSDAPIYGINTGFGSLCTVKISPDDTIELQKNLLLSHSVGVGEAIDKKISKMMLVLKLHALCKGHSGISMEIVERILFMIQNDIVPVVPSQGSVGSSGDLAPLAHLFLPLIGEGFVWQNSKKVTTESIFEAHGLKPVTLHPKAVLALINGTQFIAAHSIYVVDQLLKCMIHQDWASALLLDAYKGSISGFRKELQELRPFPANIHIAAKMTKLLTDSEMLHSHVNCDRVQDPYSMRCIPQVHGSSREAWYHLKTRLEIEINSVTDNPVIVNNNTAISGGNFHGQPLALPLDYVSLAASELGNISDRRIYLILEGIENVPQLLLKDTGINSGFMILQYTTAALTSENKTLCFPASADSIPTSLGQEDHVSMGSISSRKAMTIVGNLQKIIAVETLCAAQAFEFQRPLTSSTWMEEYYTLIRKTVSFAEKDRIFSNDIEKIITFMDSDIIMELNKNLCNELDDFSVYKYENC